MNIGDRFGCWVIQEKLKAKSICKCDCGIIQEIRNYDLLNKKTSMCRGCASKQNNKGHGASEGDPTYSTWLHMRSRCTNPNDKDYNNYGGRGITVDPIWMESFEAFLMSMGPRPSGTTLDRKDSNGNYTKSNCHWANPFVQNSNTSSNIRIEHLGRTMVLSEWIRELGLLEQEDAIRKRIDRGTDPLEALLKPVKLRK